MTDSTSDQVGSAAAGERPGDQMADPVAERRLAAGLFNATWQLMDRADRTDEDDDAMVHMAHASRHHWGRVGGPENRARGEWQCSRVYAVLGRAEPSLYHAGRCLELCERYELVEWDLAFAHEAMARARAVAGDAEGARQSIERARAVPVAAAEDRDLLATDLDSVAAMLADAPAVE